MKKMMFIAVMMSVMLMPAQMMAKNNNRDFAKPRVEKRMDNKRDFKVSKRNKRDDRYAKAKPYDKKFRKNKPARKPKHMSRMRRAPRPKPMPCPAYYPAPRPRPVPRPVHYHNHCCTNDVMETAATIVGIAALASLIAD